MVPAEATDSQDCGEHGIRLCGTAMWKMHCTDMLPDSVPRAAVNSGLSGLFQLQQQISLS